MSDCIFCKIIEGVIPSHTVYEDDEFKVILDRFPSTHGHTLIIPKQHVENVFEMDPELGGRLFTLAVKMSGRMKEAFDFPGLNLLQNNGAVAGQSVFHFHLHLIPRYEKDGVKVKWDTIDPTPEDFERILGVLRKTSE